MQEKNCGAWAQRHLEGGWQESHVDVSRRSEGQRFMSLFIKVKFSP